MTGGNRDRADRRDDSKLDQGLTISRPAAFSLLGLWLALFVCAAASEAVYLMRAGQWTACWQEAVARFDSTLG